MTRRDIKQALLWGIVGAISVPVAYCIGWLVLRACVGT